MTVDRSCPARRCAARVEAVGARFEPVTFALHGAAVSGQLTTPAHVCTRGHRHGWTLDPDYLLELTADIDELDDSQRGPDGPPPSSSMFGRPRCGSCAERLKLQLRPDRATAEVRVTIASCPDPVVFDVDLPACGCRNCTTVPSRHTGGVANTPAELLGWLFELVAPSMPLDQAALSPRR